MQRTFSSGYALTLHENLVPRFRKVGSSGWLTVETLKNVADQKPHRPHPPGLAVHLRLDL